MKKSNRMLALLLAVLVAGSATVSAASIPTRCDEAYYATLDYYGGILEGGVVKSYAVGTDAVITDYGSYDQVVNLTNDLAPEQQDGAVVFRLGSDDPEKFYFEGKTDQPFRDLPWSVAVSYRHNGAPALAEDLGGASGLFEIDVDVVPNPSASSYSRTNLVLTVATAFHDDDITSLEAPGAEEQLIGNLRAVLFAVLPGEERHFAIRVGSDDFSFPGLVFLAVPATLAQLDQVAALRDAKEELEDSYDAMQSSLDALLDRLDGVGGSLDTAADGLDQLSGAMQTVSDGAGGVYARNDQALADLGALAGALGRLDGAAAETSQAVADLTGVVNEMNAAVQSLRPELETGRALLESLQKDAAGLSEALSDLDGYSQRAAAAAGDLSKDLGELEESAGRMRSSLDQLEKGLRSARSLGSVGTDDLLAMLTPEEQAQMKTVLQLRKAYEASPSAGQVTFQQFAAAAIQDQVYQAAYAKLREALLAQGVPEAALPDYERFLAVTETDGSDPVAAAIVAAKAQANQQVDVAAQAQAASDAYDQFAARLPALDAVNGKLGELSTLLAGVTVPTADVVDELSRLCAVAEDADGLYELTRIGRDILLILDDHQGEAADLLDQAGELGALITRLTDTADRTLGQLDSLNGVLNGYEPTLQSTLDSAQAISAAAQAALRDAAAALQAAQSLVQSNAPALNAGATAALDGASAALRSANADAAPVDGLRDAKDDITDLIESQWDAHSGEADNLLLIDPAAPPESMTSPGNAAPASLQYVMRTQEIRAEEPASEDAPDEEAAPAPTTFWGRVKAMFVDLWHAITGLFH